MGVDFQCHSEQGVGVDFQCHSEHDITIIE